MIQFEGEDADAVWRQAVRRVGTDGVIREGRDQPTREVLHAVFTIRDPRQRLVFARPINPAFAIAEVLWIMAGANDADFLRFWNPRMGRFTDDRDPHVLHGAYGDRLGSRPRLGVAATAQLRRGGTRGFDQIKAAYEALRHSPHSRQVVLQIWDSRRDLPDPEPRSRDIPCNIVSHLLVRDGRLDWLQVMRSNDLMWGLPYNIVQFTSMQEIMAGWLGVEVGAYTHISDSLHVYERHWAELDAVADTAAPPRNTAHLGLASYEEWERIWARLVDGALALIRHADAARILAVAQSLDDVPPAYAEWVAVLTAEALGRGGHDTEAAQAADAAGAFWGASWRRWRAERQRRDVDDL